MNSSNDNLLDILLDSVSLYAFAIPLFLVIYFFVKSKKKKALTIIEKLDREIEKHALDYKKKLVAYKNYDKSIVRNKEEFFNFYDLIAGLERSMESLRSKTCEIEKNIHFLTKIGYVNTKSNHTFFEKDYNSILEDSESIQNNINIDKEMLFNNFKEL